MSERDSVFHAVCACGQVEFEGLGRPIMTVACYCDDCQAAGKQIDAMPHGHGGVHADGGTVSVLFRKDKARCVRGSELLTDHRLKPGSPTARIVATCCNSNVATRFDNWWPMMPLRTYSSNAAPLTPELCIMTKFAPDASAIEHTAPRYAAVPPSFILKILTNIAQLGFGRLGLDGSRVY